MNRKAINRATIRLVEERLKQYPFDKRLVEAWETERRELAGDIQSSAGRLGEILKGTGLHSDPTFAKVVRLDRMAQQVDEARWYVQAIDDVMDLLTGPDRRLIEMKYFENKSDVAICNELHISQSKFYAIRRRALTLFARRMGLS